MAHNIKEHDAQYGLEQAWHGLTKVVPEIDFRKPETVWLNQWDVAPHRLHVIGVDGKAIETPFSILKASDVPDLIIGRPFDPETYTVVSNQKLLAIIGKAFSGTKHKIVSLGSLQNREKVFVTISLESLKEFKVAGREFEAFLNFGNGFCNGTSFFANTSNVCTVCDNTYTMNLLHKGQTLDVRLKHTKNMADELENLPEIIDAAVGVQAEFAEALNGLSKVKCSALQAERTFAGFLTDERDTEKAKKMTAPRRSDVISTRGLNTVKRLTDLFGGGKGNKGRDYVDVFSAATDFYSHESSGGDDKRKQFESSGFGSALRKKQEFFELIRTDKGRDSLEKRGAFVLELPEPVAD